MISGSNASRIGRIVPWSLLDYSDEDLGGLLESRSFFQWRTNPTFGNQILAGISGYAITNRDGSYAAGLPAPPDVQYAFLKQKGFVGNTRFETIAKVVAWSGANLTHFSGPPGGEVSTAEQYWQYRGAPPVSRMIEGTVCVGTLCPTFVTGHSTPGQRAHWTFGCHGTNVFLLSVLRSANIPVRYAVVGSVTHATPSFPSEVLYLSHGDDPYHDLVQSTAQIPLPTSELFIGAGGGGSGFQLRLRQESP